ncbi:MAG: protein O-mannosyl-transferase family, partial [Planctomycetota bacterium]
MGRLSKQGDTGFPAGSVKAYLAVLGGALVLYGLTCAPAVLWQDSGLFVYRIWHNDLQGNLGIALAHPLYILLGIVVKSIPLGDFAHRVNLISAVCGAVSIANLYLLVRLWLGRALPAIVAAVTLALSWTFWQNAVIAEVYTLYTMFLFAELIMLLQYMRTGRTWYLY